MRSIRRPAVLALITALALPTLSACVESGRSSTGAADSECPWEPDTSVRSSVRIGYQKVPNADLVVKDRRVLESCLPNADITWSPFASGGDVVQAFGSDSIDLGLAGSSPSTQALSQPLSLAVSVVWIHDVIGDAESLVARDPKVTDVRDLQGSTIGVPFGSTSHFSLLQALSDAGLQDGTDVRLVNLEPEKIPAAWRGGDIDAAWIWDPVLSQLKADGHVVLSSADTAQDGKPTYDLGLVDRNFVAENPEVLSTWTRAQDYGVALIEDQPEKAAESVAVELGVSTDEARKMFSGLQFLRASEQTGDPFLGEKLGRDLLTTAQFLRSQGGIDRVAPASVYAEGVDPAPAKESS